MTNFSDACFAPAVFLDQDSVIEFSIVNSAAQDMVILGLKHSGKTVQGLKLARHFQARFLDLDEEAAVLIRQRYPEFIAPEDAENETAHGAVLRQVRAFYKAQGKAAFQALEVQAFERIKAPAEQIQPSSGSDWGRIIAMGGGAMENAALMGLKRPWDLWIFLDAPKEVLFERMMKGGIPAFLDPANPRDSFYALYEQRKNLAMKYSDISIDLGLLGVDEAGSAVLEKIQEYAHGRK